jgi:tetratricopeptide (TPR) repeat protein
MRLSSLATDPLLLDQVIDVLQTYSLVRRNVQEGTISMHLLVQAVLQDTMSKQEIESWDKRIIAALNDAIPPVGQVIQQKSERLISLALAYATRSTSEQSTNLNRASLLFKLAHYLHIRNQYIEAEPLYRQVLSIREQILGPDHLGIASVLNNLGELCRMLTRYEEAEQFYQHALSTAYHKCVPSLTGPRREDRLGAGGETPCEVPNLAIQ